jgi:DeoR family fructose operon transcriptional repressor
LALQALDSIRVDCSFVSANALEYGANGGFSTPDINQVQIKQCFLNIASRSIVLMDSNKLGCPSLARFATLADVDTLILDDAGNNDALQSDIRLWGNRVELITA